MSWNEYVKRIAPGVAQGVIAEAAGVTGPTVSRWMSGKQGVDPGAAASFARHFRRPVLEAFVAAGFLTAAEAKVRPSASPNYSQLSNDELLELVRARMTEEVMGNAEHPAPTNVKPLSVAPDVVPDAVAALEQEESIAGEQEGTTSP